METKKIVRWVVAGVLALLVIVTLASSVVVVDSGTVGILSVVGAVDETPLRQGLHFKAPFFSSVYKMDIKTRLVPAECSAASKDMQTISTKVALNYHVEAGSAPQLYKGVAANYEAVIIAPAVQEAVKAVSARFSAEELITRRQEVSIQIRDELTARLSAYGIEIDAFNITNLEFSKAFNDSIEAKQVAQQDALRAEQELNKVKIEAQQLVAKAEAEAQATRARADAEAYAIQVVQEQLAKNAAYIEYQKIEKWDGKLPQVQGGEAIVDLR